jgi:long-chain acyl-CoA synthetase
MTLVESATRVISAPHMLFERTAELGTRPRFMVQDGDDWRAVTWAAVADEVTRTASFLRGDVLRPGDRAIIFAHNRVEWFTAALAIQCACGVMVPVYPASTEAQMAYVARHSGARVMFVAGADQWQRVLGQWSQLEAVQWFVALDDEDPTPIAAALRAEGRPVPAAADLERRIIRWSRVQATGEASRIEPTQLLAAIAMDAPAIMLYTSGSTGAPKGVPLTHTNLAVNQADWIRVVASGLPSHGVDLLWLPMSHIFGYGEANIGTALGFTTYLCEPANVLELMPRVRPSVFMSVPAYWQKLAAKAQCEAGNDAEAGIDAQRARLAQATGGRLQFCLSGGAGLAPAVKQQLFACGLLVIEGYGLTECSPTLTLNRPDGFRFDSVGKPLPSVELRLADDGEILARGPSIFSGYHDDPDATAAAFDAEGWFHTGDIGRTTDDGFVQIVDRKKEILVTASGKNVPPANVERLLDADPMVRHAVVYGDGKSYLVAGVWLDHEVVDASLGASTDRAERARRIASWVEDTLIRVNGELARYEQIKRLKVFDEPLTVTGGLLTASLKIRRKAIYDAFRSEFEALYT